jgi:hypothetical protein
MLHLNFTDFSLIEQLVLPDVVGCPRASISDIAATVVSEFCEVTQCYREEVEIEGDGQTVDFELIPPQPDALVIGIYSAKSGKEDLLPGDYSAHSSDVVRFKSPPKGIITLIVILKPMINATNAPSGIINRWADTIASGVRYRLMAMPEKPWTNPQLASFHHRKFETDALKISADVVNQFSVVRTGRAKSNHSFFGV